MTDYVATLVNLVPDALVSYTGPDPDYDAIVWQDSRERPSREECDAAWPQIKIDLENEQAQRSRAESYREEADPLFFGWQRGENTEQEWLDKVTEIRDRYPYTPAL
jgi:hypothetical protein